VGQLSWVLHRLTGVGVLLFLCLHILDTSLIVLGPEHYNRMVAFYRLPAFRVLEVGLFASLLFHALNGVRIILIDFRPDLARLQRLLFWVESGVFLALMVPIGVVMLRPLWAF